MMVRVQIEHELHQRAFQPRELALQHDEPRARHARRRLEVHQAERLADIEMLFWIGDDGLRSPLAHDDVAMFVRAFRHLGQRRIRDLQQRRVEHLAGVPLGLLPASENPLSVCATSAFSASARETFFSRIARPMSFDAALRRSCAVCRAWIAVRRASSRPSRCDANGARPRRRRPSSKASGVSRMALMSNMGAACRPSGRAGQRSRCPCRSDRDRLTRSTTRPAPPASSRSCARR